MHIYGRKNTLLALTTLLSLVVGQDTNLDLSFNSSQIQIQSDNQYSGSSLVGWHVGAGLSYMVAGSPDSGNAFAYNSSATSAQLLDSDIAEGYSLPCYVIVSDQISSNAGPLECGAGDMSGYYDIANLSEVDGATGATITFNGISQWYVCTVQTFTYGWYQNTVVGSFGSGEPSGPGIQNCTSITSLDLVNGTSSSGGSNATTTSTSSGMGTSPTVSSTPITTGKNCSSCSTITTVITSCSSGIVASATRQAQSATAAPIATFTGAASASSLSLTTASLLIIPFMLSL